MNSNISCPCCSSSMLRHLSNRRSFWLCSHCRLEMPDSDKVLNSRQKKNVPFNSAIFETSLSSHISNQKVAAL